MKLSNVHRQIHTRIFPQSVPVFDPWVSSSFHMINLKVFNPFWHLEQTFFFPPPFPISFVSCLELLKQRHNSRPVIRYESQVQLLTRFYFTSFLCLVAVIHHSSSITLQNFYHVRGIYLFFFPSSTITRFTCCHTEKALMTVCDILTTPSWNSTYNIRQKIGCCCCCCCP